VIYYAIGRKKRKESRIITTLGSIRLTMILVMFSGCIAAVMHQAFFANSLFGALLVGIVAGIVGYVNDYNTDK
jgi:hypothetical protein